MSDAASNDARGARISTITSSLALAVSVFALAIGAWQTKLMQGQARASVWPHLAIGYTYNSNVDEDGFFWFSGRNNDLFKVKGLWVSPIDIEAALTRHPAVREAAVGPCDDSDGLTKPRAFLVLREGFVESAELIEELKAAVAPLGSYKIPESFLVVEQLPRTTLLKIDRKALRELDYGA